jgi:hypothetical protein
MQAGMWRNDACLQSLLCLQGNELVGEAQSRGPGGMGPALAAVATWLRMSAQRLLTWNKNYNVKPREISTAQVCEAVLCESKVFQIWLFICSPVDQRVADIISMLLK